MHFRSLTVNVKRCIGGFGLLLGVSVYAEFYKENGTKGLLCRTAGGNFSLRLDMK